MTQKIHLLGLNHKTSPVEIREKFALSAIGPEEINLLFNVLGVKELFVLSTCNRVEIIAVSAGTTDIVPGLLATWASLCGQDKELLQQHVYSLQDLQAVSHLFEVASSLDSMVLGEPQILGQLKDAYRQMVDWKVTGPLINRLLHKAFSVAKRIRTETKIAQNAVSISYAAVELAKEIFSDLTTQKILLIGAGEMAELAVTHLLQAGGQSIVIINRTYARAVELAKKFAGQARPLTDLEKALLECDIVITSTGSTEAIIQAREMKKIIKLRKNQPMFMIDIAVPRDIDPDVNQLDNIFLYDIDDLKNVVQENLTQRQQEAALAKEIIEQEVENFKNWLHALDLSPTIVDLLAQGQRIVQGELARTHKKLAHLPANEQAAIERMAQAIVKKIYHQPLTFLKRKALDTDSSEQMISLFRRIFNLDEEPFPADGHPFKGNPDKS